jgi:hypothetical protein
VTGASASRDPARSPSNSKLLRHSPPERVATPKALWCSAATVGIRGRPVLFIRRVQILFVLRSKGELKVPTTIKLPLSTGMTPLSRKITLDLFRTRTDFSFLLMVWAVTMLSIGAAAHFGAQSSEFSAFELLAPF